MELRVQMEEKEKKLQTKKGERNSFMAERMDGMRKQGSSALGMMPGKDKVLSYNFKYL